MEYRDFYTNISETTTEFLPFSDIKKKMWYHGRSVDDITFSLNYVGREESMDQEGPGFYFTNKLDNAHHYASPDGVILLCHISYTPTRIITSKIKPNSTVIKDLIDKSPNKLDTLTNFAENPRQAYNEALKLYQNSYNALDAYLKISGDFYRGSLIGYLNVLSKYYDGHIVNISSEKKHLIIFNPSIIQVINKLKI